VNFGGDAIQDTQVTTAAANASAPLGVGVVINVATRSGTNRFSGAANMVYQAKSWNGNNNEGGTSAVYKVAQPISRSVARFCRTAPGSSRTARTSIRYRRARTATQLSI